MVSTGDSREVLVSHARMMNSAEKIVTMDLDVMSSLRVSGTFCDITLVVDSVEMPAHKVID